jgi:hypothetical protein
MAHAFRLTAALVVAAVVLLPAASMAAPVSQTIQQLREEFVRTRIRYNQALDMQRKYEKDRDDLRNKMNALMQRDFHELDYPNPVTGAHRPVTPANELIDMSNNLAGYILAAFEQKKAAERLRQRLNERILDYMSAVTLEAMANTWASQSQATRRTRSNVRRTHRHPGGTTRSQAEFLGNAIRFLQAMPTIRSGSRPPGRSRPPGHSHSHGGRRY